MSFDRLAPHYTWMEAVLAGRRLQRCRATWLESLADARDILVVGVGHGHFLRRCAARFPHARFTAVDASAAMLREAEARVRRERQRQPLRSRSPQSGPTTTRECGAPTPPQPAQAITRESDARGSRDERERHDLRDSHDAPHPAASTRVNFLCATLPDWTPNAASFDAIASPRGNSTKSSPCWRAPLGRRRAGSSPISRCRRVGWRASAHGRCMP